MRNNIHFLMIEGLLPLGAAKKLTVNKALLQVLFLIKIVMKVKVKF